MSESSTQVVATGETFWVLAAPGEIWVTREAYEKYGAGFLRAINGSGDDTGIFVGPDREKVA